MQLTLLAGAGSVDLKLTYIQEWRAAVTFNKFICQILKDKH